MEKATSKECLVLALTYNEETEHSRRSARMFDYKDVSDFIKRLRDQIDYHLGSKGAFSFIACGEQGDRYKRCHWHVVLFSEVDLLTIGKWSAPWGVVTDRADIVSPKAEGGNPASVWRRVWSQWPFGFVTVQEPDYAGMHYAMSYALKDQFNVRNAEGTARQGKAEVFGTGYFGVSKKPFIGSRFVDRYLLDCRQRGVVPPTRKLSIEGLDYPWFPSGKVAKALLDGFADINREICEKTGRNAAGWSTLLYEARESEADLERLGFDDGEKEQGADADTIAGDWREFIAGAKETGSARVVGQKRRRCGSTAACDRCLRGATLETLAAHGVIETPYGFCRAQDWENSDKSGGVCDAYKKCQRDGGNTGPNPLCGLYGGHGAKAPDFKFIFPNSAT